MRVVHVTPTAFGAGGLFGGGERYPLELARALAAEVDCELVTFGRRARGRGRSHTQTGREPNGLRVTTLPAWGHLGRHPAHPVGPGLGPRLRGADVVHAHQLWSLPTRLVARRGHRPLAVTDHGLLTERPSARVRDAVALFLTVSRYSAEVLGAPEDRTRVIYGGADPARYFPDPDPAASPGGVLYVGRITPHKGIDTLIAALPPGVPLTVVGTTGHDRDLPERAYPALLRRLAAGKDVTFLDRVSDDALPELHRRAAVLVLPSVERTCYGRRHAISELLGLTVIEAMASGTAVIASRLGGLPEVVVDGETGFLVEPGEVDDLAARLTQVLGDPALARTLGENGRQRALRTFTWDACARRCLDAYGELV
jgi:glycosyltransferase involved in cell wall biosynthesis